MKISNEYIMREIAGEFVIVAVGQSAMDFNGIITVNDVGRFLLEQMTEEIKVEELVDKLMKEYEVDWETATADVTEFVEKLKNNNIVK